MNEWLNKPSGIRIISLILAILIYVIILFDSEPNRAGDLGEFTEIFSTPTENEYIEDVPVSILLDSGKFVVSGVPEFVDMILIGPKSVLQSAITQGNISAEVDLRDLAPGVHVVPIEGKGVPSNLIAEFEMNLVEVNIEERKINTYDVAISYSNSSDFDETFEITNTMITPSEVTVTSAKSVVDRITDVRVYVDAKMLNQEGEMVLTALPIRAYDQEGNQLNVEIEPGTVDVALTLTPLKKTVPINLNTTGSLPNGLTLASAVLAQTTVDVYGKKEVLDVVEQINTAPLDLSTISESQTVKLTLAKSENVKDLSVNEIEVTLSVRMNEMGTIEE